MSAELAEITDVREFFEQARSSMEQNYEVLRPLPLEEERGGEKKRVAEGMDLWHREAPEWMHKGIGTSEFINSHYGESREEYVKGSYDRKTYRITHQDWVDGLRVLRENLGSKDFGSENYRQAQDFAFRAVRYIAYGGFVEGGLATTGEWGEKMVVGGLSKKEILRLTEAYLPLESEEAFSYQFLHDLHDFYMVTHRVLQTADEFERALELVTSQKLPIIKDRLAQQMMRMLYDKRYAVELGRDEFGELKVARPFPNPLWDPYLFGPQAERKVGEEVTTDGLDLPFEVRQTLAIVRECFAIPYVPNEQRYTIIVGRNEDGTVRRVSRSLSRRLPIGPNPLEWLAKTDREIDMGLYDLYRFDPNDDEAYMEFLYDTKNDRLMFNKLRGVAYFLTGDQVILEKGFADFYQTFGEWALRKIRKIRSFLHISSNIGPYCDFTDFRFAKSPEEQRRSIDPETGMFRAPIWRTSPQLPRFQFLDMVNLEGQNAAVWDPRFFDWSLADTSPNSLRRRGYSEEAIKVLSKFGTMNEMRLRFAEALSHTVLTGKFLNWPDTQIMRGRNAQSLEHMARLEASGAFGWTHRERFRVSGMTAETWDAVVYEDESAKVRLWLMVLNQSQFARLLREGCKTEWKDWSDRDLWEIGCAIATESTPQERQILSKLRQNRAIGSSYPFVAPVPEGISRADKHLYQGTELTPEQIRYVRSKKGARRLLAIDEIERMRGRLKLAELEMRVDQGEDPSSFGDADRAIYFAGVRQLRMIRGEGGETELGRYLEHLRTHDAEVRTQEQSLRMLTYADSGNVDVPFDVPYLRVDPQWYEHNAYERIRSLFHSTEGGGSPGIIRYYSEGVKPRINFALSAKELLHGVAETIWTKYGLRGIRQASGEVVWPLRSSVKKGVKTGALIASQLFLNELYGQSRYPEGDFPIGEKVVNQILGTTRMPFNPQGVLIPQNGTTSGGEPYYFYREPQYIHQYGDEVRNYSFVNLQGQKRAVSTYQARFRGKDLVEMAENRGHTVKTVSGGFHEFYHLGGDWSLNRQWLALAPAHDLPQASWSSRDQLSNLIFNFLLQNDEEFMLAKDVGKPRMEALARVLTEYDYGVRVSDDWDRRKFLVRYSTPRPGYLEVLQYTLTESGLKIYPENLEALEYLLGADMENALAVRRREQLGWGISDQIKPEEAMRQVGEIMGTAGLEQLGPAKIFAARTPSWLNGWDLGVGAVMPLLASLFIWPPALLLPLGGIPLAHELNVHLMRPRLAQGPRGKRVWDCKINPAEVAQRDLKQNGWPRLVAPIGRAK